MNQLKKKDVNLAILVDQFEKNELSFEEMMELCGGTDVNGKEIEPEDPEPVPVIWYYNQIIETYGASLKNDNQFWTFI